MEGMMEVTGEDQSSVSGGSSGYDNKDKSDDGSGNRGGQQGSGVCRWNSGNYSSGGYEPEDHRGGCEESCEGRVSMDRIYHAGFSKFGGP